MCIRDSVEFPTRAGLMFPSWPLDADKPGISFPILVPAITALSRSGVGSVCVPGINCLEVGELDLTLRDGSTVVRATIGMGIDRSGNLLISGRGEAQLSGVPVPAQSIWYTI